MIIRTYSNSFHNVELHYHANRKESAYEKALVTHYLAFINRLHHSKVQMETLRNNLFLERLFTEEVQEALNGFEEKFNGIINTLATFKKKMKMTAEEFSLLRKVFKKIDDRYLKYHEEKIEPMNKLMNENDEALASLYQWFEEDMYGAYLRVHSYSTVLYKTDIRFALDITRFYDEMDSMKGDWNKLNKEWDALYKLRDETLDITNACSARVTTMNERATELELEIGAMGEAWSALNN